MSQSRSTIRFVCSNCISPLAAKRRQAGTKMRCPWCHASLIVPHESRPDAKAEIYELAGATAASGTPAEPIVSFLCSLCGTRMDAPADRAGQQVACPDCGTPAIIPARSHAAPPLTPLPDAVPPAPAEVYNVLEGQDQPPPTATEVYRRHIPVVCTLCRTRMHATEDQVGQILVCPDCGTANIVPAAQASDAPAPLVAVEGYELATASGQPAPPKDRQEFTFTCPLCQTRLQAARDQAGRTVTCPDCGTTFPVPQPPEESRWDPFQEAVGIYDVAGGQAAPAAPGPSLAAPAERREPKSLAEARPLLADRELLPPRRLERKLPPWPLVNGVFVFPFYRDSLLYWGKLAAAGIVVCGFLTAAIPLLRAGGFSAIFGVLLLFPTCLIALLYGSWTFSSLSKILAETANGAERIEEWASQDFVERFFESLYAVNSLVLGAAIGWAIERLASGLPRGAGLAASTFLLFPVILLSMLETGTALNPISPAVLGSLFSRWWVWWGFYALSSALLAATAAAVVGLWLLLGVWSAIPSAIVLAPALMTYFRLLGRLGWCITAKRRRRKAARDL